LGDGGLEGAVFEVLEDLQLLQGALALQLLVPLIMEPLEDVQPSRRRPFEGTQVVTVRSLPRSVPSELLLFAISPL